MEILRLCSSSSKSETLEPSSGLPQRSTALALNKRASAIEVLPDAPCPARARFRMSDTSYFAMSQLLKFSRWLPEGENEVRGARLWGAAARRRFGWGVSCFGPTRCRATGQHRICEGGAGTPKETAPS